MLTSRDAKLETEIQRKIIFDKNSTIEDRFKAVYKLLEMVIKLTLNSRQNQVKIMDEFKVEKVDNKKSTNYDAKDLTHPQE